MAVVALDLPDQVTIFTNKVAPEKRAAMAAVRNLSVLSGDGMAPLAAQLSRAAPLWAAQGRMPCPTSGPVFVRAANSIDIYFKWAELEPVLAAMAADFRDRPLVVFFNRGILYIGQLSPLGFDHNVESHNRRGEEPYTLFPDF
jgi:hypothetical protein